MGGCLTVVNLRWRDKEKCDRDYTVKSKIHSAVKANTALSVSEVRVG